MIYYRYTGFDTFNLRDFHLVTFFRLLLKTDLNLHKSQGSASENEDINRDFLLLVVSMNELVAILFLHTFLSLSLASLANDLNQLLSRRCVIGHQARSSSFNFRSSLATLISH